MRTKNGCICGFSMHVTVFIRTYAHKKWYLRIIRICKKKCLKTLPLPDSGLEVRDSGEMHDRVGTPACALTI